MPLPEHAVSSRRSFASLACTSLTETTQGQIVHFPFLRSRAQTHRAARPTRTGSARDQYSRLCSDVPLEARQIATMLIASESSILELLSGNFKLRFRSPAMARRFSARSRRAVRVSLRVSCTERKKIPKIYVINIYSQGTNNTYTYTKKKSIKIKI